MRFAFLSANLNAAAEQASSRGDRDACSVKGFFGYAVAKLIGRSILETAALEETAKSTQQTCETAYQKQLQNGKQACLTNSSRQQQQFYGMPTKQKKVEDMSN